MEGEVFLRLPASPELVSLARMVASGLGSRCGFNYEEVEDLRLAIDELCFSLVGTEGRDARIELRFVLDHDGLEVEGTRVGDAGGGKAVFSTDLSERILDTLVDAHGARPTKDGPVVWLHKRANSG